MQKSIWIAAAVVLLAGAAWLVLSKPAPRPAPPTPPQPSTGVAEAPKGTEAAEPPVETTPVGDPAGAPEASVRALRAKIEGYGKKEEHSAAIEAELVEALKSQDQDVRGHAAWSLGRLAPKTQAAIPALVTAFGDPVWAVSHNATWAVLRFDRAVAEPPLIAALSGDSPTRAIYAGRALLQLDAAKLTPVVEPVLQKQFAAARGTDRVAAIEAISRCKPASEASVALLVAEVERDGSTFRGDAIAGIAELGADAKTAIPVLLEMLKEKDSRIRVVSADALGRIGEASKEVVTALEAMLDDPKEKAAIAAADSLSMLGQLDALAAATRSKSTKVRANAITGLASVDVIDGKRVEIILACVDDKVWEIRLQVAAALSHAKIEKSERVKAALTKLATDEQSAVADQAKAGLIRLAQP